MAKTTTLPEFISAYQADLRQRGFTAPLEGLDKRVGAFMPPASSAKTYDEQKKYPWIPEFSAVTENIMAIVSKPRTHLRVYKEVTQAEKAVKIDNTDVTMTLKVPRFWKEKDNRMLPEYIYTDVAETDFAIYENRFVVALIDKMRSFISHIIVELLNQPRYLTRYVIDSQLDLMDIHFLQDETPDPLNPIKNDSDLLTDKDDPIIQTLRKLLDAQRILSHSVSTPFYKEVKKAKGLSDSDIHATNMLIGDRNYAACFQFYMKLINLSSDQNRKEQLLDDGYCNWAFQKILEVYKRLGFTIAPEGIPLNKKGLLDVSAITAKKGALSASFMRDDSKHIIVVYEVKDPSLSEQDASSRKRRSRVSIDFMPGLNADMPTLDDLNTEIDHLIFHRLTPEQDFENAFVITSEALVSDKNAIVINPNVAKIDSNLENMIRGTLTFLKGDAWTYSRICPVCGAYMDGENTDGNFYCPSCDSVYSFIETGTGDHNEIIWVKRLHSPVHAESKTETMVLNVLRTTGDIETERLLLRVFDNTDLDDLFRLSSKVGPLEMMGEVHTPDLASCQVLLNRFIDRDYRAVIRVSDNTLIGFAGLDEKRLDGYRRFSHKKVEVFIGEEYWGRGYATEALKGLVDYAFNALHLDMLWAAVGDFNPAGIKVLANAGFRFIDKVEDTYNKDIVEANELRRYVIFNPAPTMLGTGGGFMNQPTIIDVPELYDDVLVAPLSEEEYQQTLRDNDRKTVAAAEKFLKEEEERKEKERLAAIAQSEEEERRLIEEATRQRTPSPDDAREAARRLVAKGFAPEKEVEPEVEISYGYTVPFETEILSEEQEEEDMAKYEPIDIEITEDQTVEMEWNGKRHVLYVGKAPQPKKPEPKKKVVQPAKPAPKPQPKPVEKKPEPKPQPKPAPQPEVPLKGVIPPKNTERLDPTRELAAFGPGLSDDSQHSIHTVPFEDKIAASDDELKKKYQELSDYLVNVYGCSHRVSFGYDSYRVGKKVVVALSIGGVHLRVNTALDPKFYEGTKMRVNDDSGSKKYKDLPSYIKVIGEKSHKQAFRLIDDTMKSLGVKKKKA
ncbi:MAG: GNAT family N-acetyltransferase [Bacilli bacterium]|nr:GNAT family N-acetyltransferase [Bacilli bacterium]